MLKVNPNWLGLLFAPVSRKSSESTKGHSSYKRIIYIGGVVQASASTMDHIYIYIY